MKTRDLPWARCSKAIRNQCKNPCSHYLAHHMPNYGHCWCHCEPVELPPEFKHWAKYNRMLMLRLTVEEAPMQRTYRWDRRVGRSVEVGKRPYSNPHSHMNEKEFERR